MQFPEDWNEYVSLRSRKLNSAGIMQLLTERHSSLTEKDVRVVYEDVLCILQSALRHGISVTLPGVGTIMPYLRKSENKYDPHTDEVYKTDPRWTLSFRISPMLKKELKENPPEPFDALSR